MLTSRKFKRAWGAVLSFATLQASSPAQSVTPASENSCKNPALSLPTNWTLI
jgi:hypothetical protein